MSEQKLFFLPNGIDFIVRLGDRFAHFEPKLSPSFHLADFKTECLACEAGIPRRVPMVEWVEIKGTGVQGPVVAKKRLESGLVLGVDINGEGGIYYVTPSDVKRVPTPEVKQNETK